MDVSIHLNGIKLFGRLYKHIISYSFHFVMLTEDNDLKVLTILLRVLCQIVLLCKNNVEIIYKK
jgi:hypothetical protein